MKLMIKGAFCAMILAVIHSSSVAATLPGNAAEAIRRLESFYAEGASTTSRVQLMIIAPDVFIDPPPSAEGFAAKANVTVGVDAPSAYHFLKLVIGEMKSSRWKEAPAPGYPRWYWRIVDPSGKVMAGFLIDQERSVIGIGNAWYNVDPQLVKRLTSGFVDFATKEVLVPARDKLR